MNELVFGIALFLIVLNFLFVTGSLIALGPVTNMLVRKGTAKKPLGGEERFAQEVRQARHKVYERSSTIIENGKFRVVHKGASPEEVVPAALAFLSFGKSTKEVVLGKKPIKTQEALDEFSIKWQSALDELEDLLLIWHSPHVLGDMSVDAVFKKSKIFATDASRIAKCMGIEEMLEAYYEHNIPAADLAA